MVYYHPLKSCTELDDNDVDAGKLVVSKDVHRLLSGVHLRHLRKEFGLELEKSVLAPYLTVNAVKPGTCIEWTGHINRTPFIDLVDSR